VNTVRSAYFGPAVGCDLGALRWALFLTIFTALAILLPYACHQFALAGKVFLPMHFAVLTAAIVMGLRGGVAVALASPALSYALSGMPQVQSLIPTTVELATYAVVIDVAARRLRMPLVLSLVAAMVLGRFASIALASLVLQNTPLASQARKLFVIGIPGMLIQLALVPLISSRIAGCLSDGRRS
jgi:hypothetical protein